ncbi:hypothetical protein AVEN_228167-1 [Araneus ventricosus]|uniref:Transposase Tc1-like domain-containing protein n=1 Tax=Araneus ventricosus TaxID=182803 RepID=A0A4Y2CVE3_ARAVE|nr:hypothetical protein AVEN_228167-1 [Araneus ventricosus]
MGKCKDVTECQKEAIVFGRAYGLIVSEVSGFVGVSQRTVQRVYKQWCNTRGHETRQLLQSVNEGPSQPVRERTLRRKLHAMNIWSRVPRKRPLLTQAHKAERLQWARNHRMWAVAVWRNVMWSDESRFCLYSNDARRRVHRRPNEAFHLDCGARSGSSLRRVCDVLRVFFLL